MWNGSEFKLRGRMAMKANWGACIAVSFIMGIISVFFNSGSSVGNSSASAIGGYDGYAIQPDHETFILTGIISTIAFCIALVGMLLSVLVENPLKVGGSRFFILNQSGFMPRFETVLDGFRSGHYKNIVWTMFLMNLYIGLWTLLFIIPGIVKAYEYKMVPYILAENPGMDRKQAFAISRDMMMGEKMNGFLLDLSFFGWIFLSVFTCGILAIAYVNPYMEATWAEVYAYNKAKAYNQGFIR